MPELVVTVVFRERREAPELTWKLAVIVVGLTTTTLLTVTEPPCTVTEAGLWKLVPVSVTVTVAPRGAPLGASDVRVGFADTGAVTVNDCGALTPAPVETVTLRAPVAAAAPMLKVAVI